ncbi:MAG: acylphosphatase [Arcobacteraceae bacterium]
MTRYYIQIGGIVQGVGFRPFIKNLSIKYDIKGFVKNDSNGLVIEAEGEDTNLKAFIEEIQTNPPKLSKITSFSDEQIDVKNDNDFVILLSDNVKTKTTFVSPDMKICDDCLQDIKDTNSRFYGYFATNCTNCGPRYSIIKTLPYDRCNTSMDKFVMCEVCKSGYENTTDRRFHAQPLSLPNCGPK